MAILSDLVKTNIVGDKITVSCNITELKRGKVAIEYLIAQESGCWNKDGHINTDKLVKRAYKRHAHKTK